MTSVTPTNILTMDWFHSFDLTVISLLSFVLISEVVSLLAQQQLLISGNITFNSAKYFKLDDVCSSGSRLTCLALHLAIRTSDGKAKVFFSLYGRLNSNSHSMVECQSLLIARLGG